MAEFPVTLIEAPMGGGKTVTATGQAVDRVFENIYAIKAPNGDTYKVSPYKLDYVKLDASNQIDEKYKDQIIHVPSNYQILTKTKIFCNYHLYGVPYKYTSTTELLDLINTRGMQDALWIIDEGWLAAEARKGMNPLTILITQYSQLLRKLGVECYVLTQHGRFIDWRIRYITRRKILTSCNEKTWMVKLLIQDLRKGIERTTSYWSPIYWKYFDTNELPEIPETTLERARKWA